MTRQGSTMAHDVAVIENLRVPMRDGISLAADVWRPASPDGTPLPGPFPVILERTPYDRTRQFQHRCGGYFASRGYVWVAMDCRGRGGSEGEFHFYNPHHEGLDGHDTVEWLAAQDWCDGKIGTTGLSFAGANQQAMAVMRPPALSAQFINDCGYNYWWRTLRNRGAFAEGIFAPYVVRMAISGHEAAADPSIRRALEAFLADIHGWIRRLPLRPGATPLALAPSYEKWYFEIATQGDYTELYRNPMANLQDFIDDYPDIPVCLTASWYGNRHGWGNLEKFRILKARNTAPVKLIMGHWLHQEDFMEQRVSGDVNFGNASWRDLNDTRLRWFDRFLKGLDTGIEEGPPLEIFVMGGGSGRRDHDNKLVHGGRWVGAGAWPLPGTETRHLYLSEKGLVPDPPGAETALDYVFDPADPVPTIGGGVQNPRLVSGLMQGGGFDQRCQPGFSVAPGNATLASRPDVLVFRTPPLAEDLEIAGDVMVRLRVRSSATDTDFTAKLIDEYPPGRDYPQGYALNLVDEIVRMSYREDRRIREPIEPGRVYEIELGPMPIANLFRKGHRVRLDISSSSFPQFDVNPNTGAPFDRSRGGVPAVNTVLLGGAGASVLTLPVRPGKAG